MRLLVVVVLLAACAARSPSPATPDYRPIAQEPARARALLYAGCLADAVAHHAVAEARDATTNLLLFTCTGDTARAFFDGLAGWSARIGSEFAYGGRTYRSTTRVRHDLFGVDYCATDGTRHECVISLNAGAFVR